MAEQNNLHGMLTKDSIPVNGAVVLTVSEDKLTASLYITEERDGGMPITREDISREIEKQKITYNVDLAAAQELLEEKRYNKKILLSKGFMPINGQDGQIRYLFEATNELVPKKGKLGEVDYKDLGLVRNITEGEIIAKITQPTDGIPGMNVYGMPLPAVNGKPPKYGVGAGTALSEDETEISAIINGNLAWQKDRFAVEETIVIKESVDVATGNIDFIGNVLIKGEVKENFTVKSKKNITINGTATGATIIADGDVTINLGSINSDIVAQGDIKVGFCENSKIECRGNFISQSIIGGEIFCGGSINAVTGRGVVVGGKYTALNGFNANIIGSESYAKTYVTLGNNAVLTEEKLELTSKIKDLEERIKKLLQVSEILQEHKKNNGQLPPDREAMLTTAIRSRFTSQREVKLLIDRIKDIDHELEAFSDQYVIVQKQIWPGVVVRIGTDLLIVDKNLSKIMIGRDGEGRLTYLPYSK